MGSCLRAATLASGTTSRPLSQHQYRRRTYAVWSLAVRRFHLTRCSGLLGMRMSNVQLHARTRRCSMQVLALGPVEPLLTQQVAPEDPFYSEEFLLENQKWTSHFHPQSEQVYFHNHTTHESHWYDPRDSASDGKAGTSGWVAVDTAPRLGGPKGPTIPQGLTFVGALLAVALLVRHFMRRPKPQESESHDVQPLITPLDASPSAAFADPGTAAEPQTAAGTAPAAGTDEGEASQDVLRHRQRTEALEEQLEAAEAENARLRGSSALEVQQLEAQKRQRDRQQAEALAVEQTAAQQRRQIRNLEKQLRQQAAQTRNLERSLWQAQSSAAAPATEPQPPPAAPTQPPADEAQADGGNSPVGSEESSAATEATVTPPAEVDRPEDEAIYDGGYLEPAPSVPEEALPEEVSDAAPAVAAAEQVAAPVEQGAAAGDAPEAVAVSVAEAAKQPDEDDQQVTEAAERPEVAAETAVTEVLEAVEQVTLPAEQRGEPAAQREEPAKQLGVRPPQSKAASPQEEPIRADTAAEEQPSGVDIIKAEAESAVMETPAEAEPSEEEAEEPRDSGKAELKLVAGAVMLPHPEKAKTGGEDAFFVSTAAQGAVGVADGVGGWMEDDIDPAEYARTLMRAAERAVEEVDWQGSGNGASSDAADGLRRVLQAAHEKTAKLRGSATACVAAMGPGGVLQVANLGDSGFRVIRAGSDVYSSEAMLHEYNMPFQLASMDLVPETDCADDAELYELDLEDGDVFVLATDGLFDNLWNKDIERLVKEELRRHKDQRTRQTAEAVAKKLAAAAHAIAAADSARTPWAVEAAAAGQLPVWQRFSPRGGKMDDCTVVVGFAKAA